MIFLFIWFYFLDYNFVYVMLVQSKRLRKTFIFIVIILQIIFLQRENEQVWWESMKKQMLSANGFFLKLLKIFSPTFAHLNWYSIKMSSFNFFSEI